MAERDPRPPIHRNCRCTTIPILKSWEELGFEGLEDVPLTTRSSMDGYVPAKLTFEDWLKTQPPSVQMAALGKSRAEMFRSGASIGDFVSDNLTPMTLRDLRGEAAAPLAPLTRADGVLKTIEALGPTEVPLRRVGANNEVLLSAPDVAAYAERYIERVIGAVPADQPEETREFIRSSIRDAATGATRYSVLKAETLSNVTRAIEEATDQAFKESGLDEPTSSRIAANDLPEKLALWNSSEMLHSPDVPGAQAYLSRLRDTTLSALDEWGLTEKREESVRQFAEIEQVLATRRAAYDKLVSEMEERKAPAAAYPSAAAVGLKPQDADGRAWAIRALDAYTAERDQKGPLVFGSTPASFRIGQQDKPINEDIFQAQQALPAGWQGTRDQALAVLEAHYWQQRAEVDQSWANRTPLQTALKLDAKGWLYANEDKVSKLVLTDHVKELQQRINPSEIANIPVRDFEGEQADYYKSASLLWTRHKVDVGAFARPLDLKKVTDDARTEMARLGVIMPGTTGASSKQAIMAAAARNKATAEERWAQSFRTLGEVYASIDARLPMREGGDGRDQLAFRFDNTVLVRRSDGSLFTADIKQVPGRAQDTYENTSEVTKAADIGQRFGNRQLGEQLWENRATVHSIGTMAMQSAFVHADADRPGALTVTEMIVNVPGVSLAYGGGPLADFYGDETQRALTAAVNMKVESARARGAALLLGGASREQLILPEQLALDGAFEFAVQRAKQDHAAAAQASFIEALRKANGPLSKEAGDALEHAREVALRQAQNPETKEAIGQAFDVLEVAAPVVERMAPTLKTMVVNHSALPGRANAHPEKNEISLFGRERPEVVVHELGHHVEFDDTPTRIRAHAHRLEQARAPERGQLPGYGPDEVFLPAKSASVPDQYMLKIYPPHIPNLPQHRIVLDGVSDTEVISMGLQALLDTELFAKMMAANDGSLELLWATLRGK